MKPPPKLSTIQRIPHRVDYPTVGEAPFGELPYFFYAGGVNLWIPAAVQIELLYELLGERTPGTLTQHGSFCKEVHAGFIVALEGPVRVYSLISASHPFHQKGVGFVIENLFAGECRINVLAKLGNLLPKP